ncbi:hypothetical protein V7075_09530 [Neobacillus drentensis]|uniref:hypothetical protein n=1 Tax=Neobacillus drentensis TaxID=220684 RepID=UPI0030008E5B
MNKYNFLFTSLMGIVALSLVGCQSSDGGQKDKVSANDGSKAVTIVDGIDKKVVLENGYAKNFVMYFSEGTEMFSITQSAKPYLGIGKDDLDGNIAGSVFAKYHPEILKVNTNIHNADGKAPNVEEVLKLDPDVVYQWSGREGGIKPL